MYFLPGQSISAHIGGTSTIGLWDEWLRARHHKKDSQENETFLETNYIDTKTILRQTSAYEYHDYK
jgi:hypothetical protein